MSRTSCALPGWAGKLEPDGTLVLTDPAGRSSQPARPGDDAARLLAQIAAGDKDALACVYDSCAGRVFGLACRVLADARLAEAVVEEVFVHLWERPESFDPARPSLACQLLTDARRRSLAKLAPGQVPVTPKVVASPTARGAEIGDGGGEGLADLSTGEREVVELAYFGGYTARQIGFLLDVTEASVCARIDAGLQRLRRAMANENDA